MSLALGAMVLLGSALFIIPGLILGATYFMALPAALDRGLGAGAAMAEARRLALKDLLSTVLFFTGAAVLGGSGLVLMVVGLCVTLPWSIIAMTLAYSDTAAASDG